MGENGEALIEFDGVDLSLGNTRILSDVSWELKPGEHWVVLGPNGCGKTSLLKLIRGEHAPDPERGRRVYRWNGRESESPVFAKEDIAFVSPEQQERYLQIEWDRTAWDVVLTGFHGTDYLYRELTRKETNSARALVKRLEVDTLMKRNVQTLSQGELRRILVARALVGRPKLLLLDEVCDGLDVRTRNRLLAWIETIARKETQIVMATHREEEFIPSLTHVLEMGPGTVKRLCPFSERFGKKAKLAGRKASPTRQFTELIRPARKRNSTKPFLFRLEDVSVYQGKKWILRDANLRVDRGEQWAILGHNGAGKSTLLKLLLGEMHQALGGTVERFNETRRHTLWEIRQRVGFVSMDFQMRFREELSGADAIGTGFFGGHVLYDKLSRQQQRKVDELIELFDLGEFAKLPATAISYGQLRRILIARALVHDPEVLILDEPFDGLESSIREALDRQLERIADLGTGMIMVTHHPEDLPQCMTHGLVIDDGRIVKQGLLRVA